MNSATELISQFMTEAEECLLSARLLDVEMSMTKARIAGKMAHAEFLYSCIDKLTAAMLSEGE